MVRTLPLSHGTRRSPGVTLLEILVAVAVLAAGLSTIFQIFPMGFAASAKSSAQTTAFELAARKLEDVRNNHLFGGVPTAGSGPPGPADNWKYWGALDAPNPDGTTYQAVNTNFQFVSFSATQAPEKSFFYRVDCVPVQDPARKYLEMPCRGTAKNVYGEETYEGVASANVWRGFASLYRVTVTVRGPLRSQAEAQDAQWTNNTVLQKGAVQVQLVTYVANKNLGDALLAVDPVDTHENSGTNGGDKPVRNGTFPNAYPAPGSNYIYIKGIDPANGYYPFPENFTVFNRRALSLYETDDAGPTLVDGADDSGFTDYTARLRHEIAWINVGTYPTSLHGMGANEVGLDNILIFCWTTGGSGPGSTAAGYLAESNKVVALHPPGVAPNQSTLYWRVDLLHNLIIRDGDYTGRTSPLMDGAYTSDKAIDPGNSGKFNYKVGTYTGTPGSGTYGGTRVRFLMRMERRS